MRLILNVLWLALAGLWLFLAYMVIGVLWCITIIGIPFGIALFKLAAEGLFPLGKRVVPTDPPRSWFAAGSTVGAAPIRS